jgi:hypothetical protein
MATFHAEGKTKFIVLTSKFEISHFRRKFLCVMFGFHLGIIHVSKDEAYDDDNNVIKSIYHVLVLGDFVWNGG